MARQHASKATKVVKPQKKPRRSTKSTKQHTFQSFSERIANIKIDPIRRRRTIEDEEELRDGTFTYFGRALEEWKDLNLSATFSSFAKEVSPLCDNLPSILHNEQRIMDLLESYLDKDDALALEPLLSLLSHLAHDLGSRFEKHFRHHSAIRTVTALAARHDDPAVVEWSFTCLAWLFKFLRRLLVPELDLLYTVMAPYLGREKQKPYIIRFAAESMAFLVRKAAANHHTDPKPLNEIMTSMLHDCVRSQRNFAAHLHSQGIMTLLTESIKGVQHEIHSAGQAVLDTLLTSTQDSKLIGTVALDIVQGTLTSIIHHADADTLAPIVGAIVAYIDRLHTSVSGQVLKLASRVLLTLATVRKGTRIADWPPLVKCVRRLLQHGLPWKTSAKASDFEVSAAAAAIFQYAPISVVHQNCDVFEMLEKRERSSVYFFKFCDLFHRLGPERFDTFLRPYFTRHATSFIDSCAVFDDELHDRRNFPWHLVLKLSGSSEDIIHFKARSREGIASDLKLALGVVGKRETDHSDDGWNKPSYDPCKNTFEDDVEYVALANSMLATSPYLEPWFSQQRTPLEIVRTALDNSSESHTLMDDFALGTCLGAVLDSGRGPDQLNLWSKLCTNSRRFTHLPKFWGNLHRYAESEVSSPRSLQGSHMDQLYESISNCLSLSSHEIRESALLLTQLIYEKRGQPVPEVLTTAVIIELTPISLETTRTLSMNIRKLASSYCSPDLDPLMRKVIPAFTFGLLHLRLSEAWTEACSALAQMSTITEGRDATISIARAWIQSSPPQEHENETEHESPPILLDMNAEGFRVDSDFECSNLEKVSAICKQVVEGHNSGYPTALQKLRENHVRVPAVASNARGQALLVLGQMPAIAERYSRVWVRNLLEWMGNSDGELANDSKTGTTLRWTRKDQKAMLSLFAQFTNLKVLPESDQVYEGLLKLCSNGDVEIQQSALKAVLAWKDPLIVKHQEHLTNLLDEDRFREELAALFEDSDDGEGLLRDTRPTEVIRLMLRILYGRSLAGGDRDAHARRKAILVALSQFGGAVLGMFLDLALGDLADVQVVAGTKFNEDVLEQITIPPRRQLGMINMLEAFLDTFSEDMGVSGPKLLNPILLCSIAATRTLEKQNGVDHTSLLRHIRQLGTKCLVRAFGVFPYSDVHIYARVAADELIRPRLVNFTNENTEGVSGSLRLISTWASATSTQPLLFESDGEIIRAVADLFCHPKSKDEVRLFILQEVLDKLLDFEGVHHFTPEQINSFVKGIEEVIEKDPSKPLLDACVSSLTLLSRCIRDRTVAAAVLQGCSKLLTRPSRLVSPPTKTKLLQTTLSLLERIDAPEDDSLLTAVCGLFSRLQYPHSRSLLSQILTRLSKSEAGLQRSAEICRDLNSFDVMMHTPNHKERERGFTAIYTNHQDFAPREWMPIVHNCLFFIKDADDLVNRTSASRGLDKFIDAASSSGQDFMPLVADPVFSGLIRGGQSSSELVRAEYLRLIGRLAESFPEWSTVKDLTKLTHGGDDEASFFSNILHIQQHRRLRALRRLSDDASLISSKNAEQLFIPLLEHFLFNPADGDSGRTLTDQSVQTLGALAIQLKWSTLRATFKRYSGYLSSDEKDQKVVLRLLGALIDALKPILAGSAVQHDENAITKRFETIQKDFLPPLMSYLHHKDESTVDRRMPVAVSIVKILLLLPRDEMTSRLPAAMTDLCQVLRSRSQEARDQARRALTDILALVGPTYLQFILKELRSALQRGYQLHVLSFTVHSLLVHTTSGIQPGDLDECLLELVSIVMDDIFGITGQEKDAEEYKSGMKEVKSSKSYDTIELLASTTSIQQLGRLIQPLRALLSERLDSQSTKKIDDLLNRIRKGIERNPTAADSRDILTLCHEIVREIRADRPDRISKGTRKQHPKNEKLNRYLIQAEPGRDRASRNTTTSQLFKLVSFALNLVRKTLRHHDDLMTPANLEGFLPIIGDSLVEGQEDVKLAAIKLLSAIMKVPMLDLQINAPVYAGEAMSVIRTATSLATEASRASLDLLTAVLREKDSVPLSERDLAAVLKAIKNDMDEPDRQGMVFKFLRAVLGSKIMIPEVYDTLDQVGIVTVTNPDRSVREGSRSVYLQFILNYPQSKDRWKKQSAFLVENLRYEHASGRQNVMELLNQLLPKLPADVLDELVFTLFVALVPVHASDPDTSCKEMAGLLIKELFKRANDNQLTAYLALLDSWLGSQTNQAIKTAALKCEILLLDSGKGSEAYKERLLDHINESLTLATDRVSDEANDTMNQALRVFDALVRDAPQVAFGAKSVYMWNRVQDLLRHRQAGLLAPAARLLFKLFSHLASSASKHGPKLRVPLGGSEPLNLVPVELRELCFVHLGILEGDAIRSDEDLKAQIARNLVFLARCFADSEVEWKTPPHRLRDAVEDDLYDEQTRGGEKRSAMAYLFGRLSYIIRQENLPVESRTAAVQCQTEVLRTIGKNLHSKRDDGAVREHCIPDLETVLRPLYSLTDASISRPETDADKVLVEKARGLLDMVQKEVGADEYIKTLGAVQRQGLAKREERRQKRRIEAVSAPEMRAREKKKKRDANKARRKEKSAEARGQRMGY